MCLCIAEFARIKFGSKNILEDLTFLKDLNAKTTWTKADIQRLAPILSKYTSDKQDVINNINLTKTDKILKIILFAAIFELMFRHNTPKKVIINEYLLASEYFLEKIQVGYLNAILDKISKELRKDD